MYVSGVSKYFSQSRRKVNKSLSTATFADRGAIIAMNIILSPGVTSILALIAIVRRRPINKQRIDFIFPLVIAIETDVVLTPFKIVVNFFVGPFYSHAYSTPPRQGRYIHAAFV